MVLIGHSQGGVLTRLMVADSGTRFWDNVSTEPLAATKMTPDARDLVQTASSSTQAVPETIEEGRRILRKQVARP